MSEVTSAHDGADGHLEFLSFRLGGENYCIDILKVQEIRGYESVTAIANTPAFIKGVINLRGSIVPIVDLRIKFNLAQPRYDPTTIVIILNLNRKMVGVVVDSVSDVIAVARDDIKPAPRLGGAIDTAFISGMITQNNQMLIMLDIENLMSSGELDRKSTRLNSSH